MDFFTHIVFGALMYLLFLKEVTFDYLLLAMFFAILPDLDIFIFPLRRIFKSNYLQHRSGSHSYIIGIILSGIIGGIYSILTQKPFFIYTTSLPTATFLIYTGLYPQERKLMYITLWVLMRFSPLKFIELKLPKLGLCGPTSLAIHDSRKFAVKLETSFLHGLKKNLKI